MKIYDIKDIPDSSPRLFEIIQYASQGYPYKQIAEFMGVKLRTIKNRTNIAYRNYNATGMIHLVSLCYKAGIL